RSLEAGHLLEEGVVATGRLRAALDDVPGDDRSRERVPVVALPAVMPRRGPDHDGGIGHASGDDDVGASPERVGDAPPAEVRVRRPDLLITKRLTRVEV